MEFLICAADSQTSCSRGAICNGARRISSCPMGKVASKP
jgi:hypothetical protein